MRPPALSDRQYVREIPPLGWQCRKLGALGCSRLRQTDWLLLYRNSDGTAHFRARGARLSLVQ